MSQADSPFISVVVPFYNVEGFIEQALQSLLDQDFQDFEIICVNDGSTDNSAQKVADFAQKKQMEIQLLNQENKGAPAARNAGLKVAQGEYIQFLDSDDYLKPGKLSTQVALLKEHPQTIDVIAGSQWKVRQGRRWKVPSDTSDPWKSLFTTQLGVTSANLWRRKLLLQVGGWREDKIANQEYFLLFDLLKAGAVVVSDPAFNTVKLTCRPGSIWEAVIKDPEKFYHFMDFRAQVFEYLTQQGMVTQDYLQTYKTIVYTHLERLHRLKIYDKAKVQAFLEKQGLAELEEEIQLEIRKLWNNFLYQKSGERKNLDTQLFEYGALALPYGVELLTRKSEPFGEIARVIQTIKLTSNKELLEKVYQLYQQETKAARRADLASVLATYLDYEFSDWKPSPPLEKSSKTVFIKRFFAEDMEEVEEILHSQQIPYQAVKWINGLPEFPAYEETYDIHLLEKDFLRAVQLLKESFLSEESIENCPACGSDLSSEEKITVCPECELNLGFSDEQALADHPFYQFVQLYHL